MNPDNSRPIALITGAGSGIGEALAIESSKRGYDLVLMGRNEQNLQKVAAVCKGLGSLVVVVAGDVGGESVAEV